MEHFLTKKAQPSWLIKFLEILLLLSLGLWTVAGVAVSIEQFSETVESVDVAVYAILISGPLLVVLWIIRRIWFRNRARKIAVTLAWESECVISWTQLNEHAHIRNSQALVMELYEKGYLTGIAPRIPIEGLDLDDLGTHVGQDSGGTGGGHIVGQVDDLDPFQR